MESYEKLKVVIADDHSYLLDGVTLTLNDYNIDVIGKTEKIEEILTLFNELKPDILIMDIMFSNENGRTGIDALKEILSTYPDAKIIMFSQFDQQKLIQECYKIGAKAFLPKSSNANELIKAIEKAQQGKLYFTEKIAQILAYNNIKFTSNCDSPKSILNERELKVFQMLALGLTQVEISKKLNLHHRTITIETKKIKEKLKISRPAEFTILAMKHKLIDINKPTQKF